MLQAFVIGLAGRVVAGDRRIALGGFAVYQHPMAFVRELVGQKRRSLVHVDIAHGINGDTGTVLASSAAPGRHFPKRNKPATCFILRRNPEQARITTPLAAAAKIPHESPPGHEGGTARCGRAS